MADRNSAKKKPEKKKAEEKEKSVKKSEKVVKKTQSRTDEEKKKAEEGGGAAAGAAAGAAGAAAGAPEEANTEGNGEFQPIELPPFQIVTGEQMSPFYFKFQFRNVEYSSGRNKTLLCFRVDAAGGSAEPVKGYMEDEHATAHAEEAFFQQVLPNPSQECDVTWYVSSSPCVACTAALTAVLQQRKKLRLCIFCSRLFEWEQPEIVEGLRALANAGCKLRMMKPSDFQHVWDTYVEKDDESFAPWEDCQDNYEYYVGKLTEILK